MSNKERVIELIQDVPEDKLIFVVSMIEALKGYAQEEISPDDTDIQMIETAKIENDGTVKSLNELAKELNFEI